MSLIPLNIPPGVYRNGTEFQQSNRWRDASLIRWRDGSLRPIGGWRERIASVFNAAPRAMIAWEDFSSDLHIAAGTYNKLFAISESNLIYDITPVGLTSGSLDAEIVIGYGGGYYGFSYYGTPRVNNTGYGEATTWSLDNWGEYLVACSTSDGKLYEWDLNTSGVAAQIANSPEDCLGLLVTEERFLFALGADGNPRKIAWCDREDNTTWTPAATNEAGDIQLQTSGEIMAGIRVQGRAFILTDMDAHIANYVGPPYVYGFERVGNHCGLVARKAVAAVDEGVFWMGGDGFFMFNGSTVSKMPCDVADFIFDDINQVQRSKIYAMVNSEFGEIWWFYPDESSNENSKYISYNYKENFWMLGTLSRTAGVDSGVFSYPLIADASGNLYEHEVGLNTDNTAIYAESGPISLGNGDNVMVVNNLIPDEINQGDVNVTFKTRFHPNDTEYTHGPYTMANPTSVRFTGRQVRMRIEGARLARWRVGTMRIDAMPRGKR
jgi:hypothetical protein